jgi:hypothetical protein
MIAQNMSEPVVDPELSLTEGYCEFMGDGLVAIHQVDEDGKAHSVHITEDDLRAILTRATAK